jgi:hypothetical protein
MLGDIHAKLKQAFDLAEAVKDYYHRYPSELDDDIKRAIRKTAKAWYTARLRIAPHAPPPKRRRQDGPGQPGGLL